MIGEMRILKLFGGKPLSGDLAAFEGATGSAVLVAAPSSVGKDAHADSECAAKLG